MLQEMLEELYAEKEKTAAAGEDLARKLDTLPEETLDEVAVLLDLGKHEEALAKIAQASEPEAEEPQDGEAATSDSDEHEDDGEDDEDVEALLNGDGLGRELAHEVANGIYGVDPTEAMLTRTMAVADAHTLQTLADSDEAFNDILAYRERLKTSAMKKMKPMKKLKVPGTGRKVSEGPIGAGY